MTDQFTGQENRGQKPTAKPFQTACNNTEKEIGKDDNKMLKTTHQQKLVSRKMASKYTTHFTKHTYMDVD